MISLTFIMLYSCVSSWTLACESTTVHDRILKQPVTPFLPLKFHISFLCRFHVYNTYRPTKLSG